MAYGEYTFDNAANSTIFFEYLKGKEEKHFLMLAQARLAPWVAADYEYNVCNPDSPIGFDLVSWEKPFILTVILFKILMTDIPVYMDPGQILMVGTMFVLE